MPTIVFPLLISIFFLERVNEKKKKINSGGCEHFIANTD